MRIMLDPLLHALVQSKNEAADDVLVEALRLGNAQEKQPVLEAILQRKSIRGMCGAIGQYASLSENLQRRILSDIKIFHPALREAGRSDDVSLRLAALRLIALGRQGKLTYVLSENLHDSNDALSKAATEAMVALARWVASETRKLQKGAGGVQQAAMTHNATGDKSQGEREAVSLDAHQDEAEAVVGVQYGESVRFKHLLGPLL